MVRELLGGGADVNAGTYLGMTALIGASQNGHLEVVRALLARGAKVNAKLADDAALLIMDSRNGPLQVTHARLLARGLVIDARKNHSRGGYTALIEASFHGYRDVVQALLANGAELNARTTGGITALDAAKQEGHDDVSELLVKAGAKP
jgi:ankyrin repeat protein